MTEANEQPTAAPNSQVNSDVTGQPSVPPQESPSPVITSDPAAEPTAESSAVEQPKEKSESTSEPISESTTDTVSDSTEGTFLGTDEVGKKEDKATEVKDKSSEEKSESDGDKDDKQADEPAPTYENFVVPEGFALDEKRLSEFTGKLSEFEKNTKASHEEVQKFGQQLIDSYVSETQQLVSKIHESYQNAWTKQQQQWSEELKKDSELGGNRYDTTAKLIRDVIKKYGGSEDEKKQFRDLVNQTGIGNAVPVVRMFARLSNEINQLKVKYESEAGSKQLAASRPPMPKKSFLDTMYGSPSA